MTNGIPGAMRIRIFGINGFTGFIVVLLSFNPENPNPD
jgi:hypothetical protein